MSAKEEPTAKQEGAQPNAAAAGAQDEQINLRVQNHDGAEVFFKIKRGTPLRKLMDAYCLRQSINPNSIRFLYDGQRLQPERSPKEYDMDNNDIIDIVIEQQGGSF
ncbi:hypothetical protein SAMD00019534_033440 [Acytostelium subglobosum LB1]|uniref:hypothetical protein n=1 Tax=Acytostelium subglobosum LB1 TaxID=1410327 RepID=UPI00064488AB|nr:hypothetical protein SAMD00019534_033440 [Acytostelium subglobosum LB1]GAM20169.1 hypothetical protein SAMD00019534_033440 [Acytostelium subglobosum LB1]|eukprot:XP_012759690.1 hypothetical protein SAMD00019534_033440 [Acytostelium subglobosum LB1]